MKKFLLALILVSLPLLAQAPPQIPLTGNIGVEGSVAVLGGVTVQLPSDANYTLTPAQWANKTLVITSATPLTATRNIVLPLNKGQEFNVENGTTGGQALELIGATGTGVSVGAGTSTSVFCDGVNYIQISGAGGGSPGGATGSVQYNNGGSFGGVSGAAGNAVVFGPSAPADFGAPPVPYTGNNILGYEPSAYALGDSITYGALIENVLGAYPYQLAKAWNGRIVDNGNPSFFSQQMDPKIFSQPFYVNPAFPKRTPIVYTIGTNNANGNTTNANQQANFNVNIGAQYYWMALQGTGLIKTSTSSGVTKTGTWAASTIFGPDDPGISCTGATCGVTVTGSGTTLALVVALNTASNTATATVTCDGTPEGTVVFTGSGGVLTRSQTAMNRYTLPAGAHSCTMQGTTSGTIFFEWAAILPGTSVTNAPIFIAGNIPPNVNDVANGEPTWRNFQSAWIAQMQADGLVNTGLADYTTAFTNSAANFIDGVTHPIQYVHYLMAQTVLAVLNPLMGTSMTLPPYAAQGIAPTYQSGNVDAYIGSCGATNTTGFNNTCTPYSLGAITTGTQNTVVGVRAATELNTGQANTVTCFQCFISATNDVSDSIYGSNAGNALNGSNSINLFGFEAGQTATNPNHLDAFGAHTLAGCTSCAGIAYGSFAGQAENGGASLATDTSFTIIGYQATKGSSTVRNNYTLIGHAAQIDCSNCVELASGNGAQNNKNVTNNTLQFDTVNFLDESGNAAFNTFSSPVSTVASNNAIQVATSLVHVTGTVGIQTINPPTPINVNGGVFTGCVNLIADAAWSIITGGNITIPSSFTATVGNSYSFCDDGTNWHPQLTTSAALTGTTPSIGGTLVPTGCTNQTAVTISGASTGMACVMSGAGSQPGNLQTQCYVSAVNTVVPQFCTAIAAGVTPTAQTYNIRVIP